ncbi:basic-leucine zipper transcription factor family protein [Striga asiatica]|uniref:Basic-leucine zipper transcription factor family protein n=1 Tax=Striga asiatica TaxID=4170 RepID=A0A5A7QB38_STRAF|nr:basic-leucine zipper transcription factor family protein [Striga asiatica]
MPVCPVRVTEYSNMPAVNTKSSTLIDCQSTVLLASSSDKERSKKEVVMVDPVEAKRLAAKQMEQIKAKERFKASINGAWAMVGLTAGLVIEGHTGNTILSQEHNVYSSAESPDIDCNMFNIDVKKKRK